MAQIHELNTFAGTLGAGAYLAIDDGTDTGKISSQSLLAATEARIDNIIAGPAPSAEEIVDARLGADGVVYPSLGDAIRDQFTDVKSELNAFDVFDADSVMSGYAIRSAGQTASLTGGYRTQFIPLFNARYVSVSVNMGSSIYGHAFYDEEYNFISFVASMGSGNGTGALITEVPTNAKYLIVSGITANISNMHIFIGQDYDALISFYKEISNNILGSITENVAFTTQRGIKVSDGTVGSLSGATTWAASSYIEIPIGTSLIVTNANNAYGTSATYGYAFYDADKNFIAGGQFPPIGDKFVSEIPILDTYKYIRMTNYSASSDHDGLYITFGFGAVGELIEDVEELQSNTTSNIVSMVMDDIFLTLTADDEIVYYSTSQSNCAVCDVSNLQGETVFISANQISTTYRLIYVFADADGVAIDSYKGSNITPESLQNKSAVVPQNAVMLFVNTANTVNVFTESIGALAEKQGLKGKKIVTYGDSLTWYDTQDYTWGTHQGEPCVGYQTYMRNSLGLATTNRGRSGYTTPQFCAKLLEDNDLASFDYLTIMGGDNDDRLDVSIGSLQPVGSTFNTSTVYGALQSAIEYALSENPSLRIVLMTEPIGCTYRTDEMIRVSSNIPKVYRDVANLYGLPLIDLWNMSGVNELTFGAYYADPTDNHYYMYHPNNVGWKQISKVICGKFVKF